MGDASQMLMGVATIDQWARDVLRGLGVPVTDVNVSTMEAWARQESGSANPAICAGRYNPLNTTERHYGVACQGGSQGNIAGYSSYQQGVQSIVWNLSQTKGAGYEAIIAGLNHSDQPATFAAIDASAFGTHGLGAGSARPLPGESTNPNLSGTPGAPGNAVLTAATSCPEGNLFHIAMPSIIPNIDITRCQGRALLGAVALLGGGSLMLAGLIVLASGSNAARKIGQALPMLAMAAA